MAVGVRNAIKLAESIAKPAAMLGIPVPDDAAKGDVFGINIGANGELTVHPKGTRE